MIVFDASIDPLAPVQHTLSFATDVITARNKIEQRRSLRRLPANVLEFTVDAIDPVETSRIDALLQKGAPDGFKVPFWCDRLPIPSSLAAGSTGIFISTIGYNFVQGEEAILWSSPKSWEVVTINSVVDTFLEFVSPTVSDWSSANTLIVPLKVGFLIKPVDGSRLSRDALSARLVFLLATPTGTGVSWAPSAQWQFPLCTPPTTISDGDLAAAGWTRRGGASVDCVAIAGRSSGPTGLNISGGDYWAIEYDIGYAPGNANPGPTDISGSFIYQLAFGPGDTRYTDQPGVPHVGIYALIPVLSGDVLDVYTIFAFRYRGEFNEDTPQQFIAVRGDGSLAVMSDYPHNPADPADTTWPDYHTLYKTSPGFVQAGVGRFYECAVRIWTDPRTKYPPGTGADNPCGAESFGAMGAVRVDETDVSAFTNLGGTGAVITGGCGVNRIGIGSAANIYFTDFYFNLTGFLGDPDA